MIILDISLNGTSEKINRLKKKLKIDMLIKICKAAKYTSYNFYKIMLHLTCSVPLTPR